LDSIIDLDTTKQLRIGSSTDIDIDSNKLYTGYFAGLKRVSGINIKSNGDKDYFLAKYDKYKQFLWIAYSQSPGDDQGLSVVADNKGNSYVSGYFTSGNNNLRGGKYNFSNHSFLTGTAVFPNPVSNEVNVELELNKNSIPIGSFYVDIYNNSNQLVNSQQFKSSTIKINTSLYQSGTYLLSIRKGQNELIETHKFIKL